MTNAPPGPEITAELEKLAAAPAMQTGRWSEALDRLEHAADGINNLIATRASRSAPSADRGRVAQCLEIAAADVRAALAQIRIARALTAYDEE